MSEKAKRKGKAKPPADETAGARFIRVCSPRINKVLWALNQVGNCAAANYESTIEQRKQMFEAIQEELDRIKSRYELPKEEQDVLGFKFGD